MHYRIIFEEEGENGEDLIALDNLTLDQAEDQLCRFLNEGYDAYLQEVEEEPIGVGDGY